MLVFDVNFADLWFCRQVASVILNTYGSYEIVFVQVRTLHYLFHLHDAYFIDRKLLVRLYMENQATCWKSIIFLCCPQSWMEREIRLVEAFSLHMFSESSVCRIPLFLSRKISFLHLLLRTLQMRCFTFCNCLQSHCHQVLQVHKKATESTPGAVLYPGDLAAYCIDATNGRKFLLASFHGDTNGLATVPIVRALHEVASTKYPERILVIGLDANTYKVHNDQYQGVSEFQSFLEERGLISCW